MSHCTNCSEDFGYDIDWDDPPEGEGHIELTWNPEDEPSFVVSESRRYCSIECLLEDSEAHPFDVPEGDTA